MTALCFQISQSEKMKLNKSFILTTNVIIILPYPQDL